MQFVDNPDMVIRIRKLEIGLLVIVLSLALLLSAGAIAQTQIDAAESREVRRVERQVEDLSKLHNDLKLNIEVRLAKIESLMQTGAWLLGTIVLLVVTQLGTRLMGLITSRGAQSKE